MRSQSSLEGDDIEAILRSHSNTVRCIAWSADDTHLASGSQGGTARLWHVATGKCVKTEAGWDIGNRTGLRLLLGEERKDEART